MVMDREWWPMFCRTRNKKKKQEEKKKEKKKLITFSSQRYVAGGDWRSLLEGKKE